MIVKKIVGGVEFVSFQRFLRRQRISSIENFKKRELLVERYVIQRELFLERNTVYIFYFDLGYGSVGYSFIFQFVFVFFVCDFIYSFMFNILFFGCRFDSVYSVTSDGIVLSLMASLRFQTFILYYFKSLLMMSFKEFVFSVQFFMFIFIQGLFFKMDNSLVILIRLVVTIVSQILQCMIVE